MAMNTDSGGVGRAGESLDSVRLRMLRELEQTGTLDAGPWVARFPHFGQELRAFASSLEAYDESDSVPEPVDAPESDRAVVRMSRDAAERMARDQGHDPDLLLGAMLRALRKARGPRYQWSQEEFEAARAVLFPWAAGQLLGTGTATDHFRAQKTVCLLEQAFALGLFTRHVRTAAGRYDPEIREPGGIEDSAVDAGYLVRAQGSRYYMAGPHIADLDSEVDQILPDVDLAQRLIRRLALVPKTRLETWVTVEDAAKHLMSTRKRVDVPGVQNAILNLWGRVNGARKLEQAHFRPHRIMDALRSLVNLGFLPEDRISWLHTG
jgi:hypothetical protein